MPQSEDRLPGREKKSQVRCRPLGGGGANVFKPCLGTPELLARDSVGCKAVGDERTLDRGQAASLTTKL